MSNELEAVHTEICEHLATQLGYGEFSTLEPKLKAQIEDEAENYIDNWEEGPEMEVNPPNPDTKLQDLLRKRHEIAETILDLQDDALGVAQFLDLMGHYIEGEDYVFDNTQVTMRPTQRGDAIYIQKISTDPVYRGDGSASFALELICVTADETGVILCLIVEPFNDEPITSTELVGWYWKFGFRGDASEMIREPIPDRFTPP